MTYRISTLPNGLRVATEELHSVDSITVAVSVDVGARYESSSENGLSHLLEHLAFKGTKRRSAKDIAEQMDMVGGHINAYTSMDTTVYYTKLLSQDTPLAVDILADILQNSVFDKQELDREREVVLQEIAMHHDTPDDLVFDHFNATSYPKQPLGRSILGTPKKIKNYSSDDLINYMQKHYNASSMIVTAAGKVEHDKFVELVGEHFSNLANKKNLSAPKAEYKGGDRRIKRKLEQLHIMMGFESVSFLDEDYYVWQLLTTIFGGGMSSRLFQEIREKRGLAYTIQSFISPNSDTGIFGIYSATSDDKAGEMINILCDEIKKLQASISEIELQRAKNQIKASLLM
ncbi:MAG: pitrilysin family protein, partial [Pseudomonadota bacterium]